MLGSSSPSQAAKCPAVGDFSQLTGEPISLRIATLTNENTTVALQIERQGDGFAILPFDSAVTKLFKVFPLVGTENFSFPLVIHSNNFEPIRHHARNRKFNIWFNRYQTSELEKYDSSFDVEGTEILALLILHSQNPFKVQLIKVFAEQINEYRKD